MKAINEPLEIPVSVTSPFNLILDKFVERRKPWIDEHKCPVSSAADLAELAIRFATECIKQRVGLATMSDQNGLDMCADLAIRMLIQRGYRDVRTVDTIWRGWQVMHGQEDWQERAEFLRLWTELLETEDPSLKNRRSTLGVSAA